AHAEPREWAAGFDMLLDVGNFRRLRFLTIWVAGLLSFACAVMTLALQTSSSTQQPATGAVSQPATTAPAGQSATSTPQPSAPGLQTSPGGLNVVEIGRASCRERVQMSGVAAGVKEKGERERRTNDSST